jgi:hypothetical protein
VSAARLEAQAEALAQEKLFAQAAAGLIPEPTPEPVYAPSADDMGLRLVSQAPPAVAQQSSPEFSPGSNAEITSDSSGVEVLSLVHFRHREPFLLPAPLRRGRVASRPGGPAPSIDKFKAPQARPMNTLSSGARRQLLKVPEKEAVRPPAPYTFHQPSEAPREAVVPKSMQLPTPFGAHYISTRVLSPG